MAATIRRVSKPTNWNLMRLGCITRDGKPMWFWSWIEGGRD